MCWDPLEYCHYSSTRGRSTPRLTHLKPPAGHLLKARPCLELRQSPNPTHGHQQILRHCRALPTPARSTLDGPPPVSMLSLCRVTKAATLSHLAAGRRQELGPHCCQLSTASPQLETAAAIHGDTGQKTINQGCSGRPEDRS